MNNLTIFMLVFMVILLIISWITAEYISMTTGKKNKKYKQQLLLIEREKDHLQTQLTSETTRLLKAKDEVTSLRENRDQIRIIEREQTKLQATHRSALTGIAAIRDKVTHKRFNNNLLAKDIASLLQEHFPTEEQRLEQEDINAHNKLTRIKNGIGEN